ncbi:MAG: hypothetical protein BGO31_17530 [Bacteroidetes bacterium 43-16]|nr:MAG: hypothetical protein BGO31_17530 [Bacteroidetes bacterium 43-16]
MGKICFITFTFLWTICSCQKLNLNVPVHTRILGHGGMGISSQYPMNSLESILNALNIGADGIEVDVQLSKDGHLVAFHDEEMQVSTNMDDLVNNKTWDEIEEGFYTSFPHANYNIVRLEDIFEAIENREHYTFTLDCKLYHEGSNENFEQDYATAILDLLEKYQLSNVTTIESVDTNFLLLLKNRNEQVRAYYYVTAFEDGFDFIQSHSMEGVTIHQASITAAEVLQAHQAGKKIAVFGVSQTGELAAALCKAVDIVQADNLRSILNATKTDE